MIKRPKPYDPFIARKMEAKRQAEWQARLAGKGADEMPTRWSRAAAVWATIRAVVLNVLGVMVFFGAGCLLYEAVTQPTVAVAPITTPKELAEKGYTPEAAAEELRAALNRIVKDVHSRKQSADIAAQTDIPNIIVPRTGLSIETIAAQIRKLLGVANRWNVSGGVTSQNDRYEFHLRIANEKDSRRSLVSRF